MSEWILEILPLNFCRFWSWIYPEDLTILGVRDLVAELVLAAVEDPGQRRHLVLGSHLVGVRHFVERNKGDSGEKLLAVRYDFVSVFLDLALKHAQVGLQLEVGAVGSLFVSHDLRVLGFLQGDGFVD